jgi:hypothetical protein
VDGRPPEGKTDEKAESIGQKRKGQAADCKAKASNSGSLNPAKDVMLE